MNPNESATTRRGRFGIAFFVAGIAAFAGTEAATADVIYDTFGPNNEYDTGTSWAAGSIFGTESWHAMPFELGTGTFSGISITVPLSVRMSSNPNSFEFQLKIYADDGVNQTFNGNSYEGGPGTLIDSLTLSAGTDIPQQGGLSTFEFDAAVLEGNTRYWLSLETELPGDGWIGWHANAIGHEDLNAQRSGNAFVPFPDIWTVFDVEQVSGAMRIDATNIPAPGALALVVLGMVPVIRRRRH